MKWEDMTGYECKTTFYNDFSIANRFGVSAVKDTFNRAFKEWKNDYIYMTELTMVLNWQLWDIYKINTELADVYEQLYYQMDEWCIDNLKGEQLDYYIRTTD